MIERLKNKLKYEILISKKRKDPERNVIKWAIIGSGHMANTFARILRIMPGAEICAVASRSQEKANEFAKKHKILKAYGNYEELFSDQSLELDVVYIATPAFSHYRDIKLALTHRRNVLCEKPIVQNSSEFLELTDLAKRNNLFLAEAMWMYCLPVFEKANEWINTGRIGQIQKIRVDLSKLEIIDYSRAVFNAENGGVLSDYGVYPIAFAIYYLGENVNIDYFSYQKHTRGFDKEWLVILSNDEVTASITFSSTFNGDKKAAIIGEKGSIVWSPQFNRTNSIFLFDEQGKEVEQFHVDYLADGYEYEISTVQESIKSKQLESNTLNHKLSLAIIKISEYLREVSNGVNDNEVDKEV